MAGFILFIDVVLVAAVVLVGWAASTRRAGGLRLGGQALERAVRSARRRALVAIGFTVFVLTVGFVASVTMPGLLGLPMAVAPAIAGAGGLLLYAATPPSAEPAADGPRTASLEPRNISTFVPRRGLVLLAVLGVATVALLVVTGLTSSHDDAGRSRAITFVGDGVTSTASPYPGWFYAVPLLGATALLTAAALLALRRVASTPSLPGTDLAREDRAWRRASCHIIASLVGAVGLMQVGGVAVFAGNAAHNASMTAGVPLSAPFGAVAALVAGVAALAASVVLFALASLRAFDLPRLVARDMTSVR